MDATRVIFYEYGSPRDVLRVETTTIARPKANEILVRMRARPINPSDLIPIRGSYAQRLILPNIPGYEGVGIVEDVGASVSPELIGKRVLPLRGEGTWQQYVKTVAELAIVLPEEIDDVTAAQMYINPLTAWVICTEVLHLKENDVLLVNACGSAIGRIFAQLAKEIGFRLIAVTRNAKHTHELLRLGASHVVDTSQTPLREAVLTLTKGRGADAAIDSIGGMPGTELAFCVRPFGHFLTLGLLSGEQVDWALIAKETNVQTGLFHLRHWNRHVTVAKWHATFRHLFKLVQRKHLQLPQVYRTYDLHNVKQAVATAERYEGKVILVN